MLAQVDQGDQRTLGGGSLQRRPPSRVTMNIVTHSPSTCGKDRGATKILCRWVETSSTSLNGTGAPCVAGTDASPDRRPR